MAHQCFQRALGISHQVVVELHGTGLEEKDDGAPSCLPSARRPRSGTECTDDQDMLTEFEVSELVGALDL